MIDQDARTVTPAAIETGIVPADACAALTAEAAQEVDVRKADNGAADRQKANRVEVTEYRMVSAEN